MSTMRFGVEVDCGETAMSVEPLTRVADDMVPNWPHRDGYDIVFEGLPNLRLPMVIGPHDEYRTAQSCLATAMRAINAIPTVLAAEPGLYDVSNAVLFVAHRTNR